MIQDSRVIELCLEHCNLSFNIWSERARDHILLQLSHFVSLITVVNFYSLPYFATTV